MFSTNLATLYGLIEATSGSFETGITAGDNLNVADLKFSPEIQVTEIMKNTGFHDPVASVPGKRSGKLNFTVYCETNNAPGTTPWWGFLLQACGMKETDHTTVGTSWVRHIDNDKKTASFRYQMRGLGATTALVVELAGCAGNVKFINDGVGNCTKFEFEFAGKINLWNDNGSAYDPAVPPPSTYVKALSQAGTFFYDGTARYVDKFEVDLGNKVELSVDLSHSTGYGQAYISTSRPTLKFDPAIYLNSTFPAKLTAGTLSVFTFSSATGNFKVSAPKAQVVSHNIGDRSGLATYEIDALLTMNNGNDCVEFLQGSKT